VRLRSMLLCDDVRFELGGTMTLVGVYADRMIVAGDGAELVMPRLAFFTVIAGLKGVTELAWRQTLRRDDGSVLVDASAAREPHDAAYDEHRLVHLAGPVALPGPGRYRLAIELEGGGQRHSAEHRFVVETAA
jgi:hypothetical protein